MNRADRVPITNDYMFSYVMRHKDICKDVLKCLLPGIPIADVKLTGEEESLPETQKTIQGNLGNRSVRLDVYLDDGKTVFNVEMQTGDKRNLPKRVRYYGGRIDCDQLEKAQDYNLLRPTYVIFICTFDPFSLDRYTYSFRNRCDEVDGLELGDESYKLFFNTTGHVGKISNELKSLLGYFDDPQQDYNEPEDSLVKRIDDIVDFANMDDDWRRGYMTFWQAQMDARAQGRAEGEAKGRAEGEAKGRAEGEAKGTAIGAALMSKLAMMLVKDGKIEEIDRAGRDEAFRQQLLKKYGLA